MPGPLHGATLPLPRNYPARAARASGKKKPRVPEHSGQIDRSVYATKM